MTDPAVLNRVHIHCEGLDTPLRVLRMRGRETLSQPFEFVVEVETEDDIPLIFDDLDAMMGAPTTLSFGPDAEYPIHGVVREATVLPIRGHGSNAYRLRLVPRLYDTRLTRGSWIYLDQKPAEIIEAALAHCGDAALQPGDDYELTLEGSYNPREYVVQYEESVFSFISRQAEHWGLFYFFDHVGDRDKLVFGDTNAAFPQLEGFEEIAFDPRAGRSEEETVREIGMIQRMVEKDISLREYNYRIPSVTLVTEAQEIDPTGIGSVHVTGDHFWTPDEGTMMARLRAEELASHRRRMRAVTTVRGLRAGHRFALTGAAPEGHGLAREYVVVSATHSTSSPDHSSSSGAGPGASDAGLQYWNEVELLPVELAFRPPLITPKPRIHGVMHARIDAEAPDDTNVPVDEWGRYKVIMPFDVAGAAGGRSSCWIRPAYPSGGGGWGFALGHHVETEVVIFHIDGDPDRPVIAGAAPNFEQPSTVRTENAQQGVIASRHGIAITLSDS